MEEVTQKIEPNSIHESDNIRFPIMVTEEYVDRLVKNLRRRNINHLVRCTVGGYRQQICLNVGYSEIYFWVVDEEIWPAMKSA